MRTPGSFDTAPQPVGSWAFGKDDSAHKAGLVRTSDRTYLGVGDGHTITGYITPTQLGLLAEGVQDGDFNSILAP